MKTLRLHDRGDLRLHDEEEPHPADDEVLLRVMAVGLCGSDRHWLAEGQIGDETLKRPLILGHELAATVDSGPRSGERVAVDPAIPCGACDVCLAGRENLCPRLRFAGHGSTDGALRTLMAWPGRLLHQIPDSLPDCEATLLEPLGVALHAVDLGQVQPGMDVGVYGCGPIGLLLVQLLRAGGAREIVATDVLPHRIAAAREMGASIAVCSAEPRERRSGVDVAFEVAGENEAFETALVDLRPGGRLVAVGIPPHDRTSFTASRARRKGVTIVLCRRMRAVDLPHAIGVVERGEVALGPLVSARYALDGWQEAFLDLTSRRGLKIVIEPQRGDGGGT